MSHEIRVYGRSIVQFVRTPHRLTCHLNNWAWMSINFACKLTNVKSHRQKDDQSKPTIESHNKVHNCHSDISKSRDDVKQQIATVQKKRKNCLNSTIKIITIFEYLAVYNVPSRIFHRRKLRPIVPSRTLTSILAGHKICN